MSKEIFPPKYGSLHLLFDTFFQPESAFPGKKIKKDCKNQVNYFRMRTNSITDMKIPYPSNPGKIVLWCPPDVFEPSIDSEYVINTILHSYEMNKQETNIADIGCGCGIIGIALALSLKRIRCTFIDINEDAIRATKMNCRYARILNRTTLLNQDIFKILDTKKYNFDLAISNPPYIPNPTINKKNSNLSELAYRGLQLLEFLIFNSGNNYTKLLIVASSGSIDMVEKKANDVGASIRYLLKDETVAFSVHNVLKDKKWINYLLKENWLERNEASWTGYTHNLSIILISYN